MFVCAIVDMLYKRARTDCCCVQYMCSYVFNALGIYIVYAL
jgi:hypothetical protein